MIISNRLKRGKTKKGTKFKQKHFIPKGGLSPPTAVVCENGGCGPCYAPPAVLARRAEVPPQRNAAVALAKVWGSVKSRPFRGVFQ